MTPNTTCSQCGTSIYRKPHQLKVHSTHFCSRSCISEYKKSGHTDSCGECGTKVYVSSSRKARSDSGSVYCSRSCSTTAKNKLRLGPKHPLWKGGFSDRRERAISANGQVCERCGYDEYPGILVIHHKDRDRSNNEVSNLEVLCPNCHSVEHFLAKDGLYHSLSDNSTLRDVD